MSTHYAIRRREPRESLEGEAVAPTYAIRRRGLQEEIQQVVKRYIVDHRFRPGDALPGEGELAKQIGISRPSLREAMKVLQTIGAIETRHGSGTYVGSLSLDALAEGLAFQLGVASQFSDGAPDDLLELIELRKAFEAGQIARVVGLHTAEQIAHMRAINDDLLTAATSGGFKKRDLELHQRFHEPLKSRISSEFMRCFWKLSNLASYPFDERHRQRIVDEHRAIIDALAGRDPDAATAAMTHHLRQMAIRMETAYDADQLLENAITPGAVVYD